MTRETGIALTTATCVALLVAGMIVLGSRNLKHFDAALVAYTFATLFAMFGIAYRYTMWLQRPPTGHLPDEHLFVWHPRTDQVDSMTNRPAYEVEELTATSEMRTRDDVGRVYFSRSGWYAQRRLPQCPLRLGIQAGKGLQTSLDRWPQRPRNRLASNISEQRVVRPLLSAAEHDAGFVLADANYDANPCTN